MPSARSNEQEAVAVSALKEETPTPLIAICYERWKVMPLKAVLKEMAYLFHLAVKIEDVKRLENKS